MLAMDTELAGATHRRWRHSHHHHRRCDGKDASDSKATSGGNPQTGPFYVDGAEPGDTLVLHLDRITPSRAIGYTSTVVAENVVDPWFVGELPKGGPMAEWQMDVERGTATLISPATKLGKLILTK